MKVDKMLENKKFWKLAETKNCLIENSLEVSIIVEYVI